MTPPVSDLCVVGCANRRRLVACVGNGAIERMRRNMARRLAGSFGGTGRQPCESADMGIHGCYQWRTACTGTEHRKCVSHSHRGTITAPVAPASCTPLAFVVWITYTGVCCLRDLADRDSDASQRLGDTYCVYLGRLSGPWSAGCASWHLDRERYGYKCDYIDVVSVHWIQYAGYGPACLGCMHRIGM